MPIDYKRYPPDWKQISLRIRTERAQNHCEWCGLANGALGYRDPDGRFWTDEQLAITFDGNPGFSLRHVRIVLTVAHLGTPRKGNCALKPCKECGVIKAFEDFPIDKRMKGDRKNRCKTCQNAHARSYYANGFREKALVATRRWREENTDRVKAQHQEWVAANRDRRREQLTKAFRLWRDRNRDLVRAHNKANKARKRLTNRGSDDSFSAREWLTLCDQHRHRCASCGSSAELTPDHVVPLSRGGCNHIHNIQPLCLPCNLKKGTQIIDYRAKHDKLDVRDENLAALCQSCHLNYDRVDHIRNATVTRRLNKIRAGQLPLFDESLTR